MNQIFTYVYHRIKSNKIIQVSYHNIVYIVYN